MAFRISIVRTERSDVPKRRRRWTVAAATVVAGVLVSGVSYAYWTATGAGNATIASVTAAALSVNNVVVADMYPNKAVEGLTFTVSNTNPYAVSLSNTITLGTVTTGNPACPVGNLAISAGPYTITGTGPFIVPAKVGATAGTLSVTTNSFVQLSGGALDACQGVTFTFPVTVTGTQQ
jgi:hypothetical protein